MRATRFVVALALGGALLWGAPEAQAFMIDLYGTGLDDNHAPLAAGVPDSHYTVSVQPGTVAVPPFNIYPLNGTWSPDPASVAAQWITPLDTQGAPVIGYNDFGLPGLPPNSGFPVGTSTEITHPTGPYVFTTTFTLPAEVLPSAFRIEGQWMMDNYATDILVNGVSTGISRGRDPLLGESPSVDNVYQYLSFTPFVLDDHFKTGLNTLEFVVVNSACCNDQGNPVGLRVDMTAYVPEAPTLLLMALGGVVFVLVVRRKLARA